MKINPRGRPKKTNPVKKGQLKEGECRFTFIATSKQVSRIRLEAKKKNISIKKLMNEVVSNYLKLNNQQENELKLKNFSKIIQSLK